MTSTDDRSSAAVLLVPLFRGWRVIALVLTVVWTAVLVAGLRRGHEWRAQAALTTVTSSRSLPAGGGLAASLLGASLGGGVQLTPGMVVQIARVDGVLYEVGNTLMPDGRRVADHLAGNEPGDLVAGGQVVATLRGYVSAQFDNQTGIIRISVVHRDSALAREVLSREIAAVSRAYRDMSRAQARQIRIAQQERVDSAAARLLEAEEALRAFVDRNRIVSPYTPEYIRLQELERAVTTASTVYTQILADRDAAWSKELEETPAVTILDPPPPQLPREPRGLALRLVVVGMVVVMGLWSLLVLRAEAGRWLAGSARGAEEVRAALEHVPGGGAVRRLLGA